MDEYYSKYILFVDSREHSDQEVERFLEDSLDHAELWQLENLANMYPLIFANVARKKKLNFSFSFLRERTPVYDPDQLLNLSFVFSDLECFVDPESLDERTYDLLMDVAKVDIIGLFPLNAITDSMMKKSVMNGTFTVEYAKTLLERIDPKNQDDMVKQLIFNCDVHDMSELLSCIGVERLTLDQLKLAYGCNYHIIRKLYYSLDFNIILSLISMDFRGAFVVAECDSSNSELSSEEKESRLKKVMMTGLGSLESYLGGK